MTLGHVPVTCRVVCVVAEVSHLLQSVSVQACGLAVKGDDQCGGGETAPLVTSSFFRRPLFGGSIVGVPYGMNSTNYGTQFFGDALPLVPLHLLMESIQASLKVFIFTGIILATILVFRWHWWCLCDWGR